MFRLGALIVLGVSVRGIFADPSPSRSPSAPRAVTVWARDPDAIRSVFTDDHYKILDNADQEREWKRQGYWPPREREAMFRRLKIDEALRDLNDYRKDMLVTCAHAQDIPTLKKAYPMLTETQLKVLKSTVKDAAW